MANVDILELPVAIGIDGREYVPCVQGGTTKRFAIGLAMAGSASQSVQSANTVFAGPTSGAAAAPSFRTLVAADIPPSAVTIGIGSTVITSGTTTRFLYDNAGVVGETAGLIYNNATSATSFGGDLLFTTDNTNDIGASGATRPRAIYVATNVTAGGSWVGSGDVRVGAASQLYWTGKSLIGSSADGLVELYNNAGNGFTRLNLGGTTLSFPAIKRSSATLAFRLADDSADAAVSGAASVWSGNLTFAANNTYDIGTFPSTGRPRTGYFGTAVVTPIATITQGTITADASQINGSVTWNNSGIVGPAWKLNVTDTSSNASALLMDLQVASTSKFKVDKTGLTTAASLNLYGSSSGVISVLPQAAAGTFNFNLPITAGTAGLALLSGGGGASPMTWGHDAAAGITVGTTTITGGTTTRILYNNAGVLGEYTITGSGTVVAMQTSPSFITPTLGVAIGTSLALGGATIGSNALAVTGGIAGSVQIWSGTISSALQTLTGASDGFRASAANVTQLAAENTTSSSSTQGGFVGMYSNDGAAMASGDRLGGIRAGGSSSASAIRNSALIGAFASQAWVDASAYGSRWEFQTTTNSATSATTKLILGNAGVLAFGATEANTVPALKPSSAVLQVRLGDDSAFTTISTAGEIINGSSSGAISILGQAAAGTYNFNLPTGAGSSGQPLLSAGGGASPMTFGTLNLANGGTNASLTASNGGIFYSTGSAGAILSGTATANQVLLSGSSTTPAWSTATYPATTTINRLLYSSSANVITDLATTNGGMLNASSSGVPSMTITPTLGVQQTSQGKLILANTAAGAFPTTLQASNSASAAWTMTLPTTAGSADFFLKTDGSGVTSWAAVAGAGTVTSITPGSGLTSTLTATAPGSAITAAGTLYAAELVNAQTGTSYAILDGDRAKLITASNAAAQAYSIAQAGAASAFQAGWFVDLQNISTNQAGIVTITPTTSTIAGAATLKVYPGQAVRIVSDGTNYAVHAQLTTTVTIQKFTSGSGTYTTPTGCLWIRVRMVGGGGGGGSSGTSASPGTIGSAGGNTTFGSSLLTCNGGAAGSVGGGAQPGGAGGAVTLNSPAVGLAVPGGAGGTSMYQPAANLDSGGGVGGASALGGSGAGGGANLGGSAAATNTGAGGGGGGCGAAVNYQSGTGGGSGAYIEAIIISPSATYSYAVGAAGAGATAGGGPAGAGGAGAAGQIVVEEHYVN